MIILKLMSKQILENVLAEHTFFTVEIIKMAHNISENWFNGYSIYYIRLVTCVVNHTAHMAWSHAQPQPRARPGSWPYFLK